VINNKLNKFIAFEGQYDLPYTTSIFSRYLLYRYIRILFNIDEIHCTVEYYFVFSSHIESNLMIVSENGDQKGIKAAWSDSNVMFTNVDVIKSFF